MIRGKFRTHKYLKQGNQNQICRRAAYSRKNALQAKKNFCGSQFWRKALNELNLNIIYKFVCSELFTGREFKTPDLNQKIYGKQSLTFIDMNGRRFASNLGKEDVAHVKNSGHELKNFALKIFEIFTIKTVCVDILKYYIWINPIHFTGQAKLYSVKFVYCSLV